MRMERARDRRVGPGLAWSFLLLLLPEFALAQSDAVLAPRREQVETLGQSLEILTHAHYRDLEIDDEFSAKTLDRYLEALDPARIVFLRGDIDEFEADYGATLDDSVRVGDLAPAFAVFERFLQRRREQLEYFEARAEEDTTDVKFEGNATLERDRSEAPWPANAAEAEDLWARIHANDVLTMRLAGRSPAEIRDALRRRYSGQRSQTEKITADDVFALFLNVVAGEFDPHTNYFPPLAAENFEMGMALSFEGIGALLGADGEYTRVDALLPGGPAERSGELHPLDRILAVGEGLDGPMTDVVGWRVDQIVRLIRGPRGTTVRLEVLADGAAETKPRLVVLERDEVQLEDRVARSEIRETSQDGRSHRVGVITLPDFYLDFDGERRGEEDFRSSARDVESLLEEYRGGGVDAVVLDLRGNGGGALSEAQSVAGLFLGPRPVVQVRNAEGVVRELRAPTRSKYRGPLVVLVNRLSASASEIVAAAVQDYGRGVVVGSRTFGKGTVQGIVPLESGELKLTQAKFYRVTGGSTQHLGVEADIRLPETYDPESIGESALPDAMAHDSVRPITQKPDGPLARALPKLLELHRARVRLDPNYVAEEKRLALGRELDQNTVISLDEERRRAEQASVDARLLEIENERRRGLQLEPIEKLEGAETDEIDVDLEEAVRIAVDLATLTAGS